MKWWNKTNKGGVLCEHMCDIICKLNIYRQTYKTASGQTGWDGSVGHLDDYDAL